MMSRNNSFYVNYQELESLITRLVELEKQIEKTKKYAEGGNNKGETYAKAIEACELVEKTRFALKRLIDQTKLYLQSAENDFKKNDQIHASNINK